MSSIGITFKSKELTASLIATAVGLQALSVGLPRYALGQRTEPLVPAHKAEETNREKQESEKVVEILSKIDVKSSDWINPGVPLVPPPVRRIILLVNEDASAEALKPLLPRLSELSQLHADKVSVIAVTNASREKAEKLFADSKISVATSVRAAKHLLSGKDIAIIDVYQSSPEIIQYRVPSQEIKSLVSSLRAIERGNEIHDWAQFKLHERWTSPWVNVNRGLRDDCSIPVIPKANAVVAFFKAGEKGSRERKEFERNVRALREAAEKGRFYVVLFIDGELPKEDLEFPFPALGAKDWARRLSPKGEEFIIVSSSTSTEPSEVRICNASPDEFLFTLLGAARDERYLDFETRLLSAEEPETAHIWWEQLRGGLLNGQYREDLFLAFASRYLEPIYSGRSFAELTSDQLVLGAQIEDLKRRVTGGQELHQTEKDNLLGFALSRNLMNPDASPEWREVTRVFQQCEGAECSIEELISGYDGVAADDLPATAIRYVYACALANKFIKPDAQVTVAKEDILQRLYEESDPMVKSRLALALARSLRETPDFEVHTILLDLAEAELNGERKIFYWLAAREALIPFREIGRK